MTLLVLIAILSLETEQEIRHYSILRTIGLSKGQMWRRVFNKSLIRSLIAAAGGLILYLIYNLEKSIYIASHPFNDVNPIYLH